MAVLLRRRGHIRGIRAMGTIVRRISVGMSLWTVTEARTDPIPTIEATVRWAATSASITVANFLAKFESAGSCCKSRILVLPLGFFLT